MSPTEPDNFRFGPPYVSFFFPMISISIFLVDVEPNACSNSPSKNAMDNLEMMSMNTSLPDRLTRGSAGKSEKVACCAPTKVIDKIRHVQRTLGDIRIYQG